MGGRMSRNKGKRGEREVIALLQPVVTKAYKRKGYPESEIPRLQRNTMQSDGGGFDIHGLEWLALEVKYQETLCLPAWWRQTCRQAKVSSRLTPVLAYRRSREPWRFRMFADAGYINRAGEFVVCEYIPNVQKDPQLVDLCADSFSLYVLDRLQETLAFAVAPGLS